MKQANLRVATRLKGLASVGQAFATAQLKAVAELSVAAC
jgi:hypothetical protein